MNKALVILANSLPILLMIGLIPWLSNDYLLAAVYIIIIAVAFMIRREAKDLKIFLFGCIIMTASEYIFISTGVETFTRNSLFGLMPIWLPLLWGYGFVAIKRSIAVLD